MVVLYLSSLSTASQTRLHFESYFALPCPAFSIGSKCNICSYLFRVSALVTVHVFGNEESINLTILKACNSTSLVAVSVCSSEVHMKVHYVKPTPWWA